MFFENTLKNRLNKINQKPFFLLICYGLFLRVFLALSGDFLLVPDEVMQYLEQGHRITYGYGLIPWEYRLGIRPLIIPYFIAFWLRFFSYFGFNQPTSYIPAIKIIFCIFSMSIPLGMYQFCKQNYSKNTGYIALFLGCSWYELVMTAHKPLSEIFSTELMFLGLYFFNRTQTKYLYLGTLFSCFAIAVRPHVVPAIIIFFVYYYYQKPKKVTINGLAIIIVSVLIIGLFEYLTMGSPWLSYLLYLYYNINLNIASGFGVLPMNGYFLMFLVTSVGLFYVAIIHAVNPDNIKKNMLPVLIIFTILGLHSLIPHKEYRFIYPAIPFWLIIFSSYLSNLISNNEASQRAIIIVSIVSGLGLNGLLLKQQLPLGLANHYGGSYFKHSNSLNAYLYLSTISNKGGIIDYTRPWFYSGGYYYLHRKVPLSNPIINYKNSREVQYNIYSDITHATAKYIITYEKITSSKIKLIKTFGDINIYQLLNSNKAIEMNNYDFNRYIANLSL